MRMVKQGGMSERVGMRMSDMYLWVEERDRKVVTRSRRDERPGKGTGHA
jgi:hypothetical protein